MKLTNGFAATMFIIAVASLLASPYSIAAQVVREHVSNASGVCQSALPVFDVNIRKRPKAVQNEGGNSAFVTCTVTSDGRIFAHAGNPYAIGIRVRAVDGQANSLTCTGVLGYDTGPAYPYVTKVVPLPASGDLQVMWWRASDFGGVLFDPMASGLFSLSCNLNPGVALSYMHTAYVEDIGN